MEVNRLTDIDDVAVLEARFASAPVALQIYRSNGDLIVANQAFTTLFGAPPSPGHNVFQDPQIGAAARRALAGETLSMPTEQQGEHAVRRTFFPLKDRAGTISHLAVISEDVTEAFRRQREAEEASIRARFLAEASAVLTESLDYTQTLRKLATLAVPRIADWCTVNALDNGGVLRRLAVEHWDPRHKALTEEYLKGFPPTQHGSPNLTSVLDVGKGVLSPEIAPEQLVQAAQNEAHLKLMQTLGCTSCIMVPMVVAGGPVGVLSLMISDGRRAFSNADFLLAQELAYRAGLAIENAHRYAEAKASQAALEASEQRLRADLATRKALEHDRERLLERARFLAEAGAILSTSLEHEEILRQLCALLVPGLADWCSIEIHEGGVLKQIAVAHRDPEKVRWARELRERYPPDPSGTFGVHQVLKTGEPELYTDIPLDLILSRAKDDEHRKLLTTLGLRSVMIVPLGSKRRIFGTLTLAAAESQRNYNEEDLALALELARRASLAVENARLYDELRASVRVRDDFLSIAGHELRTPLAALLMQIQGLQKQVKKEQPQSRLAERLDKASRSGLRLDALINQLLDVSRITAGKLTLNTGPVNLTELVAEVVERFVETAAEGQGRIETSLELNVQGTWDGMRLEQVVTNLLSNAIKYGRGQRVLVQVKKEGDSAVLRVTDHGIGIAQEQQRRLFARFERAVESREYGGFGLGLWISRQTVEASGGRIDLHSEPGKGSTFTVRLPLGGLPPMTG